MYKIRERKKYKYMIFLLQMLCTIYIFSTVGALVVITD